MDENTLSNRVIGAAIEVHRALGPGLMELAYQKCLFHELSVNGISCETEVPLYIDYKGAIVEDAYRVDLLVDNKLIIELKAVEKVTELHKAQLLTYLRFMQRRLGLLINFNEVVLKRGIRRVVNNL